MRMLDVFEKTTALVLVSRNVIYLERSYSFFFIFFFSYFCHPSLLPFLPPQTPRYIQQHMRIGLICTRLSVLISLISTGEGNREGALVYML